MPSAPVDNPEPSPNPEPSTDPAPGEAQALIDSLALGWNLGNSLDVPEGETAWGNPVVAASLLQAVADAGFGLVRIPVTWSLHLGPAPDYAIDPAWLARVEEVVGYARDAGLYSIINLHHDGADDYDGVEWLTLTDEAGAISTATNAAVEAQFVEVWEQIAAHFAEHDDYLLFESMNEIHVGYDAPDPGYYDIITQLNQTFVDLVRGSGGRNATRFLVVPGYNTNIDYTLAGFETPTDSARERLILSVHYYDPWSFAGEASTPVWGVNSPGADTSGQESFVVEQFDKLKAQFTDQGLPVIIGEYGAVNQTGYENYRRYYMEYVTKAAHDRGFLPVYWDNGGMGSGADNFALFDRATNAISQPELVETLQRAVTETYTLEDVALP
jgi:endoglucanase